jgi:hypothetical protein
VNQQQAWARGVIERRRQQQSAGVRRCGEGRSGGGPVVATGLRTSQQPAGVSAFGFSLSLCLTLCLSIQLFRTNLRFFFGLCSGHAARTPHAVSLGFFFFFLNRINLINGLGWFKHLGLNKLLFGLILYYGLK